MLELIVPIVVFAVVLGIIVGLIAVKKYHILCIILFLIFSGLSGWFYSQSVVPLDTNTAKYLGVENVMNLQATIYTAACAIIAVLCLIGFFITKHQYDQE